MSNQLETYVPSLANKDPNGTVPTVCQKHELENGRTGFSQILKIGSRSGLKIPTNAETSEKQGRFTVLIANSRH
jgi:hypothetical protein